MRFRLLLTVVALIVASSALAAGPTSFTEMHADDVAITEVGVQVAPAFRSERMTKTISGYFTDPVAFEAAAPGLPTEDFANANVPPGGVIGCGSPVSNGNACFAPGGIADGLVIASSSGADVVALGAGFFGNATPMVAADLFVDSTILEFTDPNVFAVGLTTAIAGPTDSLEITIEAFDGTPLDVTSTPVSGTLSFWGVLSNVPLGRITLTSVSGFGEVVDDIAFGTPCSVDTFESGTIDPAWTLTGIGHANQESAAVVDDGGNFELALTSDGATAYLGADNAGFLYQELTGDFRIETDLDTSTMTTGKVWRKAGLMVRASLDHLDMRLLVMHAPIQGRLQFVAREVFGGPGNVKVALEEAAPSATRLA
ncbi:MAG: hypothetical protein AAGE94_24020, partial [Acidobacteriota bacterium]